MPQKLPVRIYVNVAMTALALCLLPFCTLYADDNWIFEPSLKQNISWDNNPLLLTGDHKTLFGSITTPQITLTDNSPTLQLSALVSADENIFNQSGFDSTDFHTNINLDKKMERWEAGLLEQTDYDTTRTSEITTLNANTLGSVRHFGNSLTPTISFNPTSVDKFSLSGSYLKSQYDSNLFTDYHIVTLTPSYQYSYDALNTLSLSVQAQRYEADSSLDSTTDSIAPTLGWTTILSPTWTAKASLGAQEYRQQGNGAPDQTWTWKAIYSADLSYSGEQDTLTLDASRALQPYVNGTEFYLNNFSLTELHNLNALFSANVAASYQFAATSGQTSTSLKSLLNASAGITYHATKKLDLIASYQYREQELTNVPGNQNDNIFTLSLAYRPLLSALNDTK